MTQSDNACVMQRTNTAIERLECNFSLLRTSSFFLNLTEPFLILRCPMADNTGARHVDKLSKRGKLKEQENATKRKVAKRPVQALFGAIAMSNPVLRLLLTRECPMSI
jgi:hypothetical protein